MEGMEECFSFRLHSISGWSVQQYEKLNFESDFSFFVLRAFVKCNKENEQNRAKEGEREREKKEKMLKEIRFNHIPVWKRITMMEIHANLILITINIYFRV